MHKTSLSLLLQKIIHAVSLGKGTYRIVNNYIHYNVWDEITHPFRDLNGATIDIWKWINSFIPYFPGHVITYIPCYSHAFRGAAWRRELSSHKARRQGTLYAWLKPVISPCLNAVKNLPQ